MLLYQRKNGGVRPKSLKCFWSIWHHYTLLSYIFSGSKCTRFIESSHRTVNRGKKLSKSRFLSWVSKTKTEECNLNIWNVFDQFFITIPCSATYALEIGARDSLKVATRWSTRIKKNSKFRLFGCFSKVKTEECDLRVWNVGITIPCSAMKISVEC